MCMCMSFLVCARVGKCIVCAHVCVWVHMCLYMLPFLFQDLYMCVCVCVCVCVFYLVCVCVFYLVCVCVCVCVCFTLCVLSQISVEPKLHADKWTCLTCLTLRLYTAQHLRAHTHTHTHTHTHLSLQPPQAELKECSAYDVQGQGIDSLHAPAVLMCVTFKIGR